jgi:DHA1 family tetracycline resistance protein-like MFS transporter
VQLKGVDRRLFTILMIVFVQMLGASMVFPILPLYAQRQFELSPQTITLLVSSFFAAQFLAGPYLGRLSDKYGRLPILIISQIGTAISFAMLGLAQNVETLFFARINIIVAQAYVTDITPREQRTQALGYIFAAFGLGFVFGPALGGALSAMLGIRIPFLLAAVVAMATVLLTWFTLDETLSADQRQANREYKKSSLGPRAVSSNFILMLILGVAFVGQFAMGLLMSTFALFGEAVLFVTYSEEFTNLGIGLLLTVVGLSQSFTQMFLLKPMLKRYGEARLVIIGSVLRTLGFFIFAVVVSPWLAALGMIVFPIGMGVIMPSLQSMATQAVADELRGGVLGVHQSVLNLGVVFGTALGGFLFAIRPTTPYWVGGGLAALTILPAIILLRQFHAIKLKEETMPSAV